METGRVELPSVEGTYLTVTGIILCRSTKGVPDLCHDSYQAVGIIESDDITPK